MNFLTQTRQAIWKDLKAHAKLSALLQRGTTFEFDNGILKKLEVSPINLPYMAMVPFEGDFAPPLVNTHKQWTHRLAIEMATAGQDIEPCEDLYVLCVERLIEPGTAYYGVASTGYAGLVFGQPKFALYDPERDKLQTNLPIWVVTVPVGLKFWRKYSNMGG